MNALDNMVSVNIAAWVVCAVYVLWGLRIAMQVVDRITGKEKHIALETKPKYVTADAIGVLQDQINRHEGEIKDIWNTFREADTDIRTEISRSVMKIERSLGEIEGQIKVMNARKTE